MTNANPGKDWRGLETVRKNAILKMLRMYKDANAGHIGASLSCMEILLYLHFSRMTPDDKFILSKGHAAAALYCVLNQRGKLSDEALASFYRDGTSLAAHPPCDKSAAGIIFGTGSLGHGLSLSAGLYLSRKFTGRHFNAYTVLSEGDCNEGSTWEAALFAAQHDMSGLFAIVDNNGLQGFGKSREVLNLEPLEKKWAAFNFDVEIAADGHDFRCLDAAFAALAARGGRRPKCLIAKTIKGHGLSFMENRLESHYLPLSVEQYETAVKEIEESYAQRIR